MELETTILREVTQTRTRKTNITFFLISPLGVNFETSIVSIEMCVTFGMLVKSGS